MLCGQCGAENPSSHRFCDCCGAAVHAKCPACEHVNRSTARFCAECGTPLGGKPAPAAEAAPAPAAAAPVLAPLLAEGERRQVTVLFGHGLQLSPLRLQLVTARVKLGFLPLKFHELDHLSEIRIQQPPLLPLQADDPLLHGGPPRLQVLR